MNAHPISDRLLDLIRANVEAKYSPHQLRRFSVEKLADHASDYFGVQMERTLVGEHMPSVVMQFVEQGKPEDPTLVPASWWDHLKQVRPWWVRWMWWLSAPRLKDLTPTVTVTVKRNVRFTVIYPDFLPPLPDTGRVLVMPQPTGPKDSVVPFQDDWLPTTGQPEGTEHMTPAEYLTWAQRRAMEHLIRGHTRAAYKSFMTDLSKEPDLWADLEQRGILMRLTRGAIDTMVDHTSKLRDFINHFIIH